MTTMKRFRKEHRAWLRNLPVGARCVGLRSWAVIGGWECGAVVAPLSPKVARLMGGRR